jgi:hypothetical protein
MTGETSQQALQYLEYSLPDAHSPMLTPAADARGRGRRHVTRTDETEEEVRAVDAVTPRGPVELLLIGGRSGAGKTAVALEISARLQALGLAHCHVEGDNLDAAYPRPADDPQGTGLTEANLRALWRTYAGVGHHRLIYVNTVSVLESDLVVRAVGGNALVVAILLIASDETAHRRLTRRETGRELLTHLGRSRRMAGVLHAEAPQNVHRVRTDGRSVEAVAAEVIRLSGWISSPTNP